MLFSSGDEDIQLCPLPDLVILRATSGAFFDIADAASSVRNEVSFRFELYCKAILQIMMPESAIGGSFKYRCRGREIDSPDIHLFLSGERRMVVECKATRMSYEAKFSGNPVDAAARAYNELAKGVAQIWRFAAHCRVGLVAEETAIKPNFGVVLTLDSWLQNSDIFKKEVIKLADQLALRLEPDLIEVDKIPILFCPIDELEAITDQVESGGHIEVFQAALLPKYAGWDLSVIARDLRIERRERSLIRASFDLGAILPWWRALERKAE